RSEDPLTLDGSEIECAGDLTRREGVVARCRDPQRPKSVPIEVCHRVVTVAGNDGGGAVAGAQQDAEGIVKIRERRLAAEHRWRRRQQRKQSLRERKAARR